MYNQVQKDYSDLMKEKKFREANKLLKDIYYASEEMLEKKIWAGLRLHDAALKCDDYEKAKKYFMFVKRNGTDEDLVNLYMQRANNYRFKENYEKAIECYQKAFNIDKNSLSLKLIGKSYLDLENQEGAKDVYNKILNADEYTQGYKNDALFGLAMASILDNEINEAKILLNQIQVSKKHERLGLDSAFANLAYAEEQYHVALELLRKPSRCNYEDISSYALLKMGLLYGLVGDIKSAVEYLSNSLNSKYTRALSYAYLNIIRSEGHYYNFQYNYNESNSYYRIYEKNLRELELDNYYSFIDDIKKIMSNSSKKNYGLIDVYEITYNLNNNIEYLTICTISNTLEILDIYHCREEDLLKKRLEIGMQNDINVRKLFRQI